MREREGELAEEGKETRAVSRRQKWVEFGRPVSRTVSHCYRGGGKAFIGVHREDGTSFYLFPADTRPVMGGGRQLEGA